MATSTKEIFKAFDNALKIGEEFIPKATMEIHKQVRLASKKTEDTGVMYRNIKRSWNKKEGIVWLDNDGMMTNGKNYGIFVHWGSRPHKIVAKNKKVLSNGVSFFGKEVNHPGFKGNPFFIDGLETAKRSLKNGFGL